MNRLHLGDLALNKNTTRIEIIRSSIKQYSPIHLDGNWLEAFNFRKSSDGFAYGLINILFSPAGCDYVLYVDDVYRCKLKYLHTLQHLLKEYQIHPNIINHPDIGLIKTL